MSYEFTKLSEVEFAEQPSTEANILIEDNGDIKKTLLSNISGSGSGVEVINFTMDQGYGIFLQEFDLVKKAFQNNMTFHVVLKTDLYEPDDEGNLIHVSFPKVNEFSKYYQDTECGVSTTIPCWLISEEKIVLVTVSVIFQFWPEEDKIVGGIMVDGFQGQNYKIEACYATTI